MVGLDLKDFAAEDNTKKKELLERTLNKTLQNIKAGIGENLTLQWTGMAITYTNL
jgi:hypothetical protein